MNDADCNKSKLWCLSIDLTVGRMDKGIGSSLEGRDCNGGVVGLVCCKFAFGANYS